MYTESLGPSLGLALRAAFAVQKGSPAFLWLDHSGGPLPDELGTDNGADYGLTGRLARVISAGQLEAVNDNGLANFSIAPGRQVQVIQIGDNLARAEHYYIHVSGKPKNETPQFDPGTDEDDILATRPGLLTPFKTPLFDERSDWQSFSNWHKANQQQGLDGDDRLQQPDPVYAWHYRPEYQFSRFALEMSAIERQFTDEQGQPYTLDLLAGQQDDGQVPTIRGDDDLVSVFYSLVGAAVNDTGLNRLSPIDGPQELVFSLGGEEVAVTLGENQQITFNNLEHIDRLDPADLLTMRLYVNQDAGNVLWEYAFTRNGLHVYYKIPGNTEETNGTPERNTEGRDDIEILSLLNSPGEFDDFQNQLPTPTLRTLGGLRLRYRYVPPSIDGATLEQVTWRIHHRGRYCTGYGVEPDHSCSAPVEAGAPFSRGIEYEPNESENVYWEPLDENDNVAWSLWAGENSDDEGVQAHLRAEYTLPTQGDDQGVLGRSYEQDFVIKTRELAPATEEEAEPMQGSDVAMLEAMLWQLGLSPQKGAVQLSGTINAGSSGARIHSHRGGSLGWTQACGKTEDTERRDIYYAGWADCAVGHVSLEGMVRRFQARSFRQPPAESRADNNFGDYAGWSNSDSAGEEDGVTGSFDMPTLAQLGRVWQHYSRATQRHGDPVVNTDRVDEGWWQDLVTLMEEGGSIPYRDPAHEEDLYTLSPSYRGGEAQDGEVSPDSHLAVVSDFPAQAGQITQAGILRAWVEQETGGKVWGDTGSDRLKANEVRRTDYRIHEGSGDEQGSMGFNHIVWRRMYGQEYSCDSNRGYLSGGEENINLYDPYNTLLAFLAAAADSACMASNGLFRAYVSDAEAVNYREAIPELDRPWAYCYESFGGGSCVPDAEQRRRFTHERDSGYNLLGKAVIAYNQGANAQALRSRHYFQALQGAPRRTAAGEFNPTHFGYWLAVKLKSYQLHQRDPEGMGGYLPFVTYIWAGTEERHPDEIPLVEDEQPVLDSEGDPVMVENPKAGQPLWCFAYGEREWMAGESFSEVEEESRQGLRDQIDCDSGEVIEHDY